MAVELPRLRHAAGTAETFGIKLLRKVLQPDGSVLEQPLDLTGYRVVVAVRVKSANVPYTRDSNETNQLRISFVDSAGKQVTPVDGRIRFDIASGDLVGAADLDQVLQYQLFLDVPGSVGVPRGAFPVGEALFDNIRRVV